MKYLTLQYKNATSRLRLIGTALITYAMLGSTPMVHATPVLDFDEANGFGDQGGTPYVFTFENPYTSGDTVFEGALLEYLDYDFLAISIVDTFGNIVLPFIQSSPGDSILFSFVSAASGFTASVSVLGDGAFGLGIIAEPPVAASVPEPSTLGLLCIALSGLVWTKRKCRQTQAVRMGAI